MEVYLLTGLGVGFLIPAIYFWNKSLRLERESYKLGLLLEEQIRDSDRETEDHRAAELELSIIKAKLEEKEANSLTPDNAVPKDMHIEKVVELSSKLTATERVLKDVNTKFEEVRGKQISERVRLGQISEQFATLHEGFKYNRKETKPLLQPIDFVCFEEDEVVFVEVKSGASKLTTKQKRIRDNIQAGRVRFEVFRINENGVNWSDK